MLYFWPKPVLSITEFGKVNRKTKGKRMKDAAVLVMDGGKGFF